MKILAAAVLYLLIPVIKIRRISKALQVNYNSKWIKGRTPRNVERVDRPHNPNVPNQKPHIHFKDGTSINLDGTPHDAGHGIAVIIEAVREWLEANGYII